MLYTLLSVPSLPSNSLISPLHYVFALELRVPNSWNLDASFSLLFESHYFLL